MLKRVSQAFYPTRRERLARLGDDSAGELRRSGPWGAPDRGVRTGEWEKAGMDGLFVPRSANEGAWPEVDSDGGAATRADEEGGPGGESEFMRRFSRTAFERGDLTGAVIRGGRMGRLMLMSCLKRAAGGSEPRNYRQRKLFRSDASAKVNIRGGESGKVVFNRGEFNSAIALTLEELRGARDAVAVLAKYASGEEALPEDSGAGTLRSMYPFLDDARDREDIMVYGEQLRGLGGGDFEAGKRLVLQRAMREARAVVEAKSQMRHSFLHTLEMVSRQAEIAHEIFDSEEFRTQAARELAVTAGLDAETDGAEGSDEASASSVSAPSPDGGEGPFDGRLAETPGDGYAGESGGADVGAPGDGTEPV
jgi:hypothetical protein